MKKWIESNVTLQLRKGHHFYLYGCIHLIAVFQWELLCSWLPVRVRIKRPFCLFTTNDAGYRYFLNLSTLHPYCNHNILLSRLCRTCFCIDSAKKNKKKRKEKNRFCMLVLVSNIAVCFYLVSAPFFIVVSEELS